MENAFGILKQTFYELGRLSELHVTPFPDAVVACCLLCNMLLNQDPNDVALLLEVHRLPLFFYYNCWNIFLVGRICESYAGLECCSPL